jgi:beta-aspartyl-peptidase (threonine type)
MQSPPILVVHGGAGSLASDEDRQQYLAGVSEALDAGQAVHGEGCRAAVRAAVMHMEAHTIMNAGRGASLAHDGAVSMDAGFMVGDSRRYGAVTGVRRSVHPVQLAEYLLDDGEYGRLLAPPESDALIEVAGAPLCEPADLVTERARRLHAERLAGASSSSARAPLLDTVGAVALDAEGHVAAAVSTGGMSLKRVGRVGDSPIVGAGFWADDRVAACVTTGVGEALLRQGTARRCVQLVADGVGAGEAAAQALAELIDFEGDERGCSGLILVTREGEVVLDHNSSEMSGGWVAAEGGREVAHMWCR